MSNPSLSPRLPPEIALQILEWYKIGLNARMNDRNAFCSRPMSKTAGKATLESGNILLNKLPAELRRRIFSYLLPCKSTTIPLLEPVYRKPLSREELDKATQRALEFASAKDPLPGIPGGWKAGKYDTVKQEWVTGSGYLRDYDEQNNEGYDRDGVYAQAWSASSEVTTNPLLPEASSPDTPNDSMSSVEAQSYIIAQDSLASIGRSTGPVGGWLSEGSFPTPAEAANITAAAKQAQSTYGVSPRTNTPRKPLPRALIYELANAARIRAKPFQQSYRTKDLDSPPRDPLTKPRGHDWSQAEVAIARNEARGQYSNKLVPGYVGKSNPLTLLLVNRQFCQEVSTILYEEYKFELEVSQAGIRFLDIPRIPRLREFCFRLEQGDARFGKGAYDNWAFSFARLKRLKIRIYGGVFEGEGGGTEASEVVAEQLSNLDLSAAELEFAEREAYVQKHASSAMVAIGAHGLAKRKCLILRQMMADLIELLTSQHDLKVPLTVGQSHLNLLEIYVHDGGPDTEWSDEVISREERINSFWHMRQGDHLLRSSILANELSVSVDEKNLANTNLGFILSPLAALRGLSAFSVTRILTGKCDSQIYTHSFAGLRDKMSSRMLYHPDETLARHVNQMESAWQEWIEGVRKQWWAEKTQQELKSDQWIDERVGALEDEDRDDMEAWSGSGSNFDEEEEEEEGEEVEEEDFMDDDDDDEK